MFGDVDLLKRCMELKEFDFNRPVPYTCLKGKKPNDRETVRMRQGPTMLVQTSNFVHTSLYRPPSATLHMRSLFQRLLLDAKADPFLGFGFGWMEWSGWGPPGPSQRLLGRTFVEIAREQVSLHCLVRHLVSHVIVRKRGVLLRSAPRRR